MLADSTHTATVCQRWCGTPGRCPGCLPHRITAGQRAKLQ